MWLPEGYPTPFRFYTEYKTSPAEAMKALRGLQSVVSAGVTYRDYAPRVSDAKVIVDRYLAESEQGDSDMRAAVAAAMRFYASAALAWSVRLSRSNHERLANDPSLKDCPPMVPIVEKARQDKFAISESAKIGIAVSLQFEPLWRCASEKIAEADRTLKAIPTGGQQ